MNNRLFNSKNPYQGTDKKVLCVCSAGLLRSPTTANILHADYHYNTRSCGIDVGHALIPIDDVLLNWADEIVCMSDEQMHRAATMLKDFYDSDPLRDRVPKEVVSLGIPDSYSFHDSGLEDRIRASYSDYLSQQNLES